MGSRRWACDPGAAAVPMYPDVHWDGHVQPSFSPDVLRSILVVSRVAIRPCRRLRSAGEPLLMLATGGEPVGAGRWSKEAPRMGPQGLGADSCLLAELPLLR